MEGLEAGLKVAGSNASFLAVGLDQFHIHHAHWTTEWTAPNAFPVMSGSSHIRSVLIGVEYRNFCRTLDVYLLFAILHGQTKSKLNYRLVTYKLASP